MRTSRSDRIAFDGALLYSSFALNESSYLGTLTILLVSRTALYVQNVIRWRPFKPFCIKRNSNSGLRSFNCPLFPALGVAEDKPSAYNPTPAFIHKPLFSVTLTTCSASSSGVFVLNRPSLHSSVGLPSSRVPYSWRCSLIRQLLSHGTLSYFASLG